MRTLLRENHKNINHSLAQNTTIGYYTLHYLLQNTAIGYYILFQSLHILFLTIPNHPIHTLSKIVDIPGSETGNTDSSIISQVNVELFPHQK